MSRDKLHSRAISVQCCSELITPHSAALSYAKDSEDISYHIFWIKWHFKRLKESIELLEDGGSNV